MCLGCIFICSGRVTHAVSETIITDSTVSAISAFELYRNGIYWWKNGFTSGEFSETGVVAYTGFVTPALTDTAVTGTSGVGGGFVKGGGIRAPFTLYESPSASNHYLIRDDYSVGMEALRDEAYAYYARGGILMRKALHLGPTDADEAITRFNASGPPFYQNISGLGVSHVEEGKIYYWNASNGNVTLSQAEVSGGAVAVPIASFGGTALSKTMVTTVLNAGGDVAGKFFIVLTTDGRLYRIPFQTNTTATLISNGISDFAVRDEETGSSSPFRLFDYVTKIYASTFSLSNTSHGKLLGINALTLSSNVEYDSGTNQVQVNSVACDTERIFISTADLNCGGLGCTESGTGNLVRRYKPTSLFISPGVWGTIAVEKGRNLRSNSQWIYFLSGNEIKKLRTDAPDLNLDLQARGLEVVQVVQDMNNSIPLIAGKATVVRGYADILVNTAGTFGNNQRPSARLTVWKGDTWIGEIEAYNRPSITTGMSLATMRTDSNRSFLFDVPRSWIQAGTLKFVFEVNPQRTIPETPIAWAANNKAEATIDCIDKAPPALVTVSLSTQQGVFDRNAVGSGYWDIINRAESLLPVNGFRVYPLNGIVYKPVVRVRFGIPPVEIVNRSFSMPSDQNLALLWVSVLHALDKTSRAGDADLHFVGMTPMGSSFNGLGGIAFRWIDELIPDLPGILEPVVGLFYLPPNAYSNSLVIRMAPGLEPASAPAWYSPRGGYSLAHELGHNYGRFHIPFGSGQSPAAPYDTLPFNMANFGPTNYDDPANILGFDWFTDSIVKPDVAGDLMSYANFRWPSRETYMAIMQVIRPGDGMAPKYENPRNLENSAPSADGDQLLLVQGTVAANFHAALLGPGYRLAASEFDQTTAATYLSQAEGLGENFPLRLRQLAADRNILSDTPLLIQDPSDPSDAGDRPFVQILSTSDGVQSLEIVLNDTVISRAEVSSEVPAINLNAPLVGTEQIMLSWSASDPDGDPLYFAVQHSRNGGGSWETLSANLASTSFSVETASLPGSTTSVIRVLATDGFNTSVATSDLFTIPTKSPRCSIHGIREGERLAYGSTTIAQGIAVDAEDGSLEGLQWKLQSKDRNFETTEEGARFKLPFLSPGSYELSLEAQDSSGSLGSASVSFEVLAFSIPETGSRPSIDGLSNDVAYAAAPVLKIPHSDGTSANAQLVHYSDGDGGRLYIAVTGLRYGTNGSPGATAGLIVDRDASGGSTAQFGDLGFFVNENGVPWQTEGDGTSSKISATPAGGFDVVTMRGPTSWNAEMCIPDSLLGGWNHAGGFLFCHDRVNGSDSYGAWPSGAAAANPGTWTPGQLGPLPVSPNQIPVADAGTNRSLGVVRGDTIVLDGRGSYDLDGELLTYTWQQTGGPEVQIGEGNSVMPQFEVPADNLPASLTFSLTVSDGHENSSSSDDVTFNLELVVAQPVEIAPSVGVGPGGSEAGVQVALECSVGPGACVTVETSVDLENWESLGDSVVDILGRAAFFDMRPLPMEGRRFYRAVLCGFVVNNGLSFVGDDAVVTVAGTEDLNAYPMTVAFRMKSTNQDAVVRGIVSRYADASFNGFSIFLYNGNLYAWYFSDSGNYVYRYATNQGVFGGPVADGKWHDVVFVVNASGGTFYVDGAITETLPWTNSPGAPSTSQPFQIGKYHQYPWSFRGELDNLSFWNRSFDADEIASLASERLLGNEAGLAAYWPVDEEMEGTLEDVTGNNHDGTLSGDVNIQSVSFP